MASLAETMPIEQRRCRELLAVYQKVGSAGVLGAAMIEAALRRADAAMASGDVVEILRSYEELKKLK